MSSMFSVATDSGRTLFATLQQIAANGTLGDYWSVTLGQWASSVAIADRKITLTEGGINDLGSYTGGTGSLAAYTGFVVKKIHDQNDSNRVIGMDVVWVASGVEQGYAIASDLSTMPALVRAELNSNPVPASNMRGTDNALLAASYTAPLNATITAAAADAATAAAQSTTAATQATAAASSSATIASNYTAIRAGKLDQLDAAISSRSTLTAAQVRTELNSNPVPASNMRGTDNALLAASYTAPANATITTAAADALAAKTSAQTTEARLTATRAGYLDNLSAGAVALQSTVSAISNSVRLKVVSVGGYAIPTSGSNVYTVDVLLYDTSGNMESPDSTPTITAANQAGTDRSANVGAVSAVSTGHYRGTYTVTSAHATEQIVLTVSAVEGGQTLKGTHAVSVSVTGQAGGGSGTDGFLSADRTKLESIYNKLPSKAYLTGTAASDGDINLAECDGSRDPFKADVSLLATAASLAANPAAVRAELNSNPVPASNMRGTDNALTAAGYTAPNNAGITTAATQATTAATQATTAATQASAAAVSAASVDGKLTGTRATKLDYLDAAITSRSTFNHAANNVTIAAGHGLATEAMLTAVKAKTDLLPAQPAAVSSIPTAAQIATQVDSTLSVSHPGNWAAGGDATATKQDQILAAVAGIIPAAPSPVYVEHLRWLLSPDSESGIAPNKLTVSAGSTVFLAMDFGELLNPGTGISAVSAVVDVSGNGLVPTDLAPSQDRLAAHCKVTALTAGKTYELKFTATTSDSQTLVGRGRLTAE